LARTFAAIDKNVSATLGRLHDYLWAGKKTDVVRLRKDITTLGVQMETFLGRASAIAKPVGRLAAEFREGAENGPALYGVISNFWCLAAAAEHLRTKRYALAAARALEAVDGPLIGFASEFGHHDWVETMRAGRITRVQYLRQIADALESKGAKGGGHLKRIAMEVAELRDAVADQAVPVPVTAARAAVHSAAVFLSLYPAVLRDLGGYADLPHKEYPRLAEFIAARA